MKKSKKRAQISLLSEKDDCYMKLKHIWQDVLFYISGFSWFCISAWFLQSASWPGLTWMICEDGGALKRRVRQRGTRFWGAVFH